MADLGKASNAANVGLFVLTAIGTIFVIWDRFKGTQVTGWGIPILLTCAVLVSGVLHIIASRSSRNGKQEAQATEAKCPDGWLHTLAGRNADDIQWWFYCDDVLIGSHNLLREKPYIDFRFQLYNCSVFTISAQTISGTIYFAGEPLRGTLEWVTPLKDVLPGSGASHWKRDCTVRLTLASEKDVAGILNQCAHFEFSKLNIPITANEMEIRQTHLHIKGSALNTKLLEAYPKLKIKIKQAALRPHYDFDGETVTDSVKGSVLTLLIEFRNPRSSELKIEDLKLDTSPHVNRRTAAVPGLIYQTTWIMDGRPENQNRLTPNLKDDLPIEAEYEEPIEGWAQFYLRDVNPEQLDGKTVNFIIIDSAKVEHSQGTPILNMERDVKVY